MSGKHLCFHNDFPPNHLTRIWTKYQKNLCHSFKRPKGTFLESNVALCKWLDTEDYLGLIISLMELKFDNIGRWRRMVITNMFANCSLVFLLSISWLLWCEALYFITQPLPWLSTLLYMNINNRAECHGSKPLKPWS